MYKYHRFLGAVLFCFFAQEIHTKFQDPIIISLGIDPQKDFSNPKVYKDAALSVEQFDRTCIGVMNRIFNASDAVLLSMDNHPENHKSFDCVEGVCQNSLCKFNKHCVKGTQGQLFVSDLWIPKDALIFAKGENPDIEQFGASDARYFGSGAEYSKATNHAAWIASHKVLSGEIAKQSQKKNLADQLVDLASKNKSNYIIIPVTGVAGDYCVNSSICDIKDCLDVAGINNVTFVAITDGIAFLTQNNSAKDETLSGWALKGVALMRSSEFFAELQKNGGRSIPDLARDQKRRKEKKLKEEMNSRVVYTGVIRNFK